MSSSLNKGRTAWLAAAGFGLLTLAPLAQAATITIRNDDGTAEGLNDPTPYTAQGGNNATTLGQARLNVFKAAAATWGGVLQSNVEILVSAKFDDLDCTATQATLGQAGPMFAARDTDKYIFPSALLSAIIGKDSLPNNPDIQAEFNSRIGQANCLGGTPFYYGLDHKPGNAIDFLAVVTHEFGHGLGFVSIVDESTGATLDTQTNRFAVLDSQLYNETTKQNWDKDTNAQRKAAAISGNGLTWSGTNTVNAVASYLTAGKNAAGRPLMYTPNPIEPGSSVSHWDKSASPDLLMEPAYNSTLNNLDVTPCAMQDMGWTLSITNCRDGAVTTPANNPPVASNQSVATTKNTATKITLVATDADKDALTYAIVTKPAHGTVIQTTGTTDTSMVTYTPTAGYTGTDTFTFTASDGKSTSAPATVSLTITNRAPTAASQTLSAPVGQAYPITLAGTDPDGDALTYTLLSQPKLGTLQGTPPNLSYTPNTTGTDSFTFQVQDTSGAVSNVATVTINNTAQTQPLTNSKPGGGAVAPALLLALAGLGFGRRRRKR